MKKVLVPFLLLFSVSPVRSAEPAAASNRNGMYIRSLMDQVIEDPGNPKARELLKNLAQDLLEKRSRKVLEERLEALRLALALAEQKKDSPEDAARLRASIRDLESRLPRVQKEPAGESAVSQEAPEGEAAQFAEDIAEIKETLSRLMDLRQASPAQVLPSTSPAPAAPSAPKEAKTPGQDGKEAAQAYFKKGIEAYTLGNTQEAVEAFKKSLELDPKNEWSAAALARIEREPKPVKQEKKAAPKEAAKKARTPSRMDRTVRELEKKADKFYEEGKLDQAAKTFKWILKMDPGNRRAKEKLAKVEKELKR